MIQLNELQPLIIKWGIEKDLIKLDNAPKQRLKLLEEVGETARAILKNDVKEIKDGLGDIFVVLVILAEQTEQKILMDIDSLNDDSELDTFVLFKEILHRDRLYFSIGYLTDICKKLDYDLTECANLAWNEIKNRKGTTIDGTFIKQ